MYRVRCSQLATLIADCGKVKNKLEWTKLDTMNESHIKLAIEIYNRANGLFTPAEVCTLDMNTGTELEPDAIKLFDEFKGTDFYKAYEENRAVLSYFERENEYITGTRDFGNLKSTYDCKISTDKNIFDLKRFKPVELGYTIQINGYGWLYGTDENYIYNALMPASFGQIKKFVDSKAYIEMLTDDQRFEYEEKVESNYNYDTMPLSKRISIKPVEQITNFPDIVKARVEVMNEWIEKNKQYF